METLRYISTLNDIREQHPESSWVRITTITMTAKYPRDINMGKFRENFKPVKIGAFQWNVEEKLNEKFYNSFAIGYRDQYSKKVIKIFPNGSIQGAGCSDLNDCKRVAKQVSQIIQSVTGVEETISPETISVHLINTIFALNYVVNLRKAKAAFEREPTKFKVTYDADRYSAVKVKFTPVPGHREVTASIFSTGKILVATGAPTLEVICAAYKALNDKLSEPGIKVEPVAKKEVYDGFAGYKFAEWVEMLKAQGIKSW
jgi:TATA-box binding protein (TBP) (component of TFIID and TFIIIB)